jgi:hypothetical protein
MIDHYLNTWDHLKRATPQKLGLVKNMLLTPKLRTSVIFTVLFFSGDPLPALPTQVAFVVQIRL